MTRQTARDEAVEMLEDILNDAEADSAVKEAAVSEASAIAQNILKETNIEPSSPRRAFRVRRLHQRQHLHDRRERRYGGRAER